MITLTITRAFKPPVITNRLAIISHLPDHFADPLDIEVNSTPLMDDDLPARILKGGTITVNPSVMKHMQKVQSVAAYRWTMTPWNLWVNRRFLGDEFDSKLPEADVLPKAECISGYGNFVEIIGERNGFYRIRATMNTADFSQFDGSFNWENYPTLWVKQSSRDRFNPPNIYNVGAGLDAYFPLLQAKQNLWIHSSHVEMFPDSPEPGGFILKGMSVYTASMKLLRIATKAGVTYPTAWKLQTKGVIPA